MQQLTSEFLFPVVVELFQLNDQLHSSQYSASPLSYRDYISKKANFLVSMDRASINQAKINHILKLQYLFEMFMHRLLNEKFLYAYFQYIQTHHRMIVLDIFRQFSNFKIVFFKIYSNHFDFMNFLIEYFETIKSDSISVYKTMRCMEKINFFDLMIQRINKLKFSTNASTVVHEVNDKKHSTLQMTGAILSLLGHLFINHSTLVLDYLFSDQEKVDGYKTLRQIILFVLQTSNIPLRQQALLFFERMIFYLNQLDKQSHEIEGLNTNFYRTTLVSVLRELDHADVLRQSRNYEYILDIFVKYDEGTILTSLNSEFSLFQFISSRFNLAHRKVQTLNLIKILKYVISKSEAAMIKEQHDLQHILSTLMAWTPKRDSMLVASAFQLLLKIEDVGLGKFEEKRTKLQAVRPWVEEGSDSR